MNKKILLIEDEDDLKDNLQEILECNGYEVITASNGKEGIEIADQIEVDAIVSDLMMPVMDGIGFLKEIKKKEKYIHVPVLILTAKVDKIAYRSGMESGANDFLTKPVKGTELLNAISSAIENSLVKKMVISKQLEQALKVDRNVRYHELRTPLFGVLSSLEILLDLEIELSDEEKKALLVSSASSAKRLNKSLQKIYLFQYLHVPKSETKTTIDVELFIKEKISEPAFQDVQIYLHSMNEDFMVSLSKEKIEFIVTELLTNSVAFGLGNIEIHLNSQTKSVRFVNSQNIIKNPKKIDPEPFKHYSDEYNEKSGLGLGLYIIKEYLNQQGFSLSIQVLKGNIFEVEINFNS
jgi:two-component system, sensor histidine kinase and response regulator